MSRLRRARRFHGISWIRERFAVPITNRRRGMAVPTWHADAPDRGAESGLDGDSRRIALPRANDSRTPQLGNAVRGENVKSGEKALQSDPYANNQATPERWPSGRRRSPAKGVYVKSVSRVRIPSSPPLMCGIAAIGRWPAQHSPHRLRFD